MQPLAESISCNFQLSFEDWLDSRDISETDAKILKRHQAVASKQRVITLMAANGHYHLPRTAFDANQLATLMRWISLAMGES